MNKKQFLINYLKNSPWYVWVIRISAAVLIAYIFINNLGIGK